MKIFIRKFTLLLLLVIGLFYVVPMAYSIFIILGLSLGALIFRFYTENLKYPVLKEGYVIITGASTG
jgi:hypothetical protein